MSELYADRVRRGVAPSPEELEASIAQGPPAFLLHRPLGLQLDMLAYIHQYESQDEPLDFAKMKEEQKALKEIHLARHAATIPWNNNSKFPF